MRIAAYILALVCAVPAFAAEDISYTADGRINPPADYREWVFLSSSIDLNYTEAAPGGSNPSVFGNVFVNPSAYRIFKETGRWPDKTIFVLEKRTASTKGALTKAGKFQAAEQGLELHVKDKGDWAFYVMNATAPAQKIPKDNNCYACHQLHGTVDTTFVQYYPTLIAIAQAKGTYHEPKGEALDRERAVPAKVDPGAPPPSQLIFRAAIEDIGANRTPATLTPSARAMLTGALPRVQPVLEKFGTLQSVKYLGQIDPPSPLEYRGKPQKMDQYEALYAGGTIVWRIFVQPDGRIGRLVPFASTPKNK